MSAQLRALETAIEMAQAALARREAPRARSATGWHAEAEARYREGETLREIGAAVGRRKDAVRAVLLARGVPMRQRGGGQEKRNAAEKCRAGRKGGLATRERHGREFYAWIGSKGWRTVIEGTRLPEELQTGETAIPNALLYGVMPRVSGGEWKALCYLCTLADGEDVDLSQLAFATGSEEEDLAEDLLELSREGLIEQRVTLPGDRVVYWLKTGEEG